MNILTAKKVLFLLVLSLWLLSVTACQTVYYNTMEKLGYHKRDVLVDRIESARDAQTEAKEQFASALERFSSVIQFEGGDLEDKYNDLKAEYDESSAKADAVHDHIDAVEDVAEALFDEWEAELNEYSSSKLRRTSERKLRQTKRQYAQLIKAMKRAEKKIDPVLSAFKDQVLFLKHNLNARAIASLKDELVSVEADVATLIREMEASITEANAFIDAMEKE